MCCRRAAAAAAATVEAARGAGGAGGATGRGATGRVVTERGVTATATTGIKTKRKVVVAAGRRNGFGVKGTAGCTLLAFLAAVSFRGMPRHPLSASAAFVGENSTLIAVSSSREETVTAPMTMELGMEMEMAMADGMHSNQGTVEQAAEVWGESDRPDTATLTKGFSIPTYLPPFPDFIPADLPQTTTLTLTTTMSPPWANDNVASGSMESSPNKQQPQQFQQSNQPHQPHQPHQPQPQPQSRLHAYDSEKKAQELRREKQLARERQQMPRRQLSLPPRNVTVQAGQHAYLPCQLHQHSSKPLSWVRLRDEHIIAVDHTTFINDARFAAMLQSTSSSPSSNATSSLLEPTANGSSSSSLRWTLLIKYVQLQDNGWYECQLATEPKMSAKVQLLVITPKTELIGDKQRFVKAGSRVELHCIVRGTLEAPKYIVWYRGDQQVLAENEATGIDNGWYTQIDRDIFGSTEHSRNTIGSLVIPVVRKTHSGNYTCEPENSQAVSIQLHVLSGEYSASAIKSTAIGLYRHGHGCNSLHRWLIFLLVALNKT